MNGTKYCPDTYGKKKGFNSYLKPYSWIKGKGGWGLPSLRDYYWEVRLRPTVCWYNPSYEAQLKNIEEGIQAIIGQ